MRKKYIIHAAFAILLILIIWQWISKSALLGQLDLLVKERDQLQNHNNQLQILSGIGPLRSTHIHADVKFYIDGKPLDFSQRKYQLTSSYIHFEEGIGDVIHVHATGMNVGHMLNSLNIKLNDNCIIIEEVRYCENNNKKIRFYANGKKLDYMEDYAFNDLDKILISYGSENDSQIQEQLNSVTDLAKKYSSKG